jgi:shikimate kinase
VIDFKNNNIYLIGMMGSWKSTIGSNLAKKLDMNFFDTDDVVEELTEMKISDIFKKYGEKKFRQMEKAFFLEKGKEFNQLFSTGGGIILDNENREILKKGITFLLEASPDIIAARIHNKSKRPLLKESENLEAELSAIWQKRQGYYYESAQHIIKTDNLQPSEVIDKILKILKKIDE